MKRYLLLTGAFFFIFSTCLQAQELSRSNEKWRLGLSFGGGYIIASTKEAVKIFEEIGIDRGKAKNGIDNIKKQLQFGGDVHYLLNTNWGVGLKYLFSSSNGTIKDVVLNMNADGITNVAGNIESQYYINFIGPSLLSRSYLGKDSKWGLTSSVALGYSHLRLEQLTINTPIIATGGSFGAFTSLGIEYYVKKQISLGCDLGLFSSSFKKAKYNNGHKTWKVDLGDLRENVSNLNFSLNARIHL